MRKAVFFIIFLVPVLGGLLGCSAGSGPSEELITSEIKKMFKNYDFCGLGAVTYEINDLSIVGKKEENDRYDIQAIVNATEGGPCDNSGSVDDYEVTISFEKFGDGWRGVESNSKYNIRKRK